MGRFYNTPRIYGISRQFSVSELYIGVHRSTPGHNDTVYYCLSDSRICLPLNASLLSNGTDASHSHISLNMVESPPSLFPEYHKAIQSRAGIEDRQTVAIPPTTIDLAARHVVPRSWSLPHRTFDNNTLQQK